MYQSIRNPKSVETKDVVNESPKHELREKKGITEMMMDKKSKGSGKGGEWRAALARKMMGS
jgi:hypothetical protein